MQFPSPVLILGASEGDLRNRVIANVALRMRSLRQVGQHQPDWYPREKTWTQTHTSEQPGQTVRMWPQAQKPPEAGEKGACDTPSLGLCSLAYSNLDFGFRPPEW
jgi:hypothetical protein